jgi:hypothetical protein
VGAIVAAFCLSLVISLSHSPFLERHRHLLLFFAEPKAVHHLKMEDVEEKKKRKEKFNWKQCAVAGGGGGVDDC